MKPSLDMPPDKAETLVSDVRKFFKEKGIGWFEISQQYTDGEFKFVKIEASIKVTVMK